MQNTLLVCLSECFISELFYTMKKIIYLLSLILLGNIVFAQVPIADAGNDTSFCGYYGELNAMPSVGVGEWSVGSPYEDIITFDEPNNPNSVVRSQMITSNNPTYDAFELVWTESNEYGTSCDTIVVHFLRIPVSSFIVYPVPCFGSQAFFRVIEDSLPEMYWSFNGGVVDSVWQNSLGGEYAAFVHWENGAESHDVSLYVFNTEGCRSPAILETVYEPSIPESDILITNATDGLSNGSIEIVSDNLQYFWLHPEIGPEPGTEINNIIDSLPVGEYLLRRRYESLNTYYHNIYLDLFGSYDCYDEISVEIIDVSYVGGVSVGGEVGVFPNPSTGSFVVDIPEEYSCRLTILNMYGQVVKSVFDYKGEELFLENQNPGLYLIIGESKLERFTLHLVLK